MSLLARRRERRQLLDRFEAAEARVAALARRAPSPAVEAARAELAAILTIDDESDALATTLRLELRLSELEDVVGYAGYRRALRALGAGPALANSLTRPTAFDAVLQAHGAEALASVETADRRRLQAEVTFLQALVSDATRHVAGYSAALAEIPLAPLSRSLSERWQPLIAESTRLAEELDRLRGDLLDPRVAASAALREWRLRRAGIEARTWRLLDEAATLSAETEPLVRGNLPAAVARVARALAPVARAGAPASRKRRAALAAAQRLFAHPSPEVRAILAEAAVSRLLPEVAPR